MSNMTLPRRMIGAVALVCLCASAQAATEYKIENPDTGYLAEHLGVGVAVDGDTMIAGGPSAFDVGVAWVFKRDEAGRWRGEQKLAAPDGIANNDFGFSVAISGDTAIIGAHNDDDLGSESGSAYVFIRTDGVWSLQQKLNPSDGAAEDWFGLCVSISGDTAVIGSMFDDDGGSRSGSVYVFHRAGEVWTQQQKLAASDPTAGKWFGRSVSISGETIVAGALGDSVSGTNSGAAYVFARAGTTWSQEQKLTAADASALDYFGSVVSVDVDTILIGAYGDDDRGSESGSAYVYTRTVRSWDLQQKLTASDAGADDSFGDSVAISGDTVVIGASADENSTGSAYVFTRSSGVWSQQDKLTASDRSEGDRFAGRVAVSGDTVAVGANWDGYYGGTAPGAAYAFVRSEGAWSQHQKLSGANIAEGDQFGSSVVISADTVVVGGSNDDEGGDVCGAIWVLKQTESGWVDLQKLIPSDPGEWKGLGDSVSISGDTILAGAPLDSDNGDFSGSAYVFTSTGGVWSQQQKILAPDGAADDWFGIASCIYGDTAIIGSFADESYTGAAYVFTRTADVWSFQQKLTASDATAGDEFGYSISLLEDTVLIGAPADDTGAGSAYVFTQSEGAWTEQAKLMASDRASFDSFGLSVSASGNTALVGAYEDDDGGYRSGSAYVFTRSEGAWTQQQKLTASDATTEDSFGISVSVSGSMAVIGADRLYGEGERMSAAYVFTRGGEAWTEQERLTAADSVPGDLFGREVSTDGDQVLVGAWSNDGLGDNAGAAYVYDILRATGARNRD